MSESSPVLTATHPCMYLVQLHAHESTFLLLVRPEVYAWIKQPYTPPPNVQLCYDEKVPANILTDYIKRNKSATCVVTKSTFTNDRALNAPGRPFDNIIDTLDYIISQHSQIAGEYHGDVY